MPDITVHRGVFPIAPTPFTDAGDLDLEGQARVLDCMIDQGVDGICILANYSEQFLLSDAERDSLLDLCLTHVAGRVPVIVTTSHFSTRLAAARSKRAAEAGASMLMLMPPYHGTALRADEKGIEEHFARVAEASGLPIMVQDAPLSGVSLSVPFLVRLGKAVPQVTHFKIEVAGAAGKLRAHIEAREPFSDLPVQWLAAPGEVRHFVAGVGQLHAGHMLEVLAGVGASAPGGFDALARSVLEARAQLASCILVLVSWDEARRRLAEALAASGIEVRAILACAPEAAPADAPAWLTLVHPGAAEAALAGLERRVLR